LAGAAVLLTTAQAQHLVLLLFPVMHIARQPHVYVIQQQAGHFIGVITDRWWRMLVRV
jgi:hypothetical protein